MTIFGWDASHYDGLLTPGILARAKAEGIGFFTHKIGEGLQDTEGTSDDTALAAARSAGIEFLGGYLVPRSNASVSAQVDYWLRLADASEPWWRDFPGWFWQIDLERWSYDNVPASVGIACAQQLRAQTGRWTILYASRGQYGDSLTGWDGPLWNAGYGTDPAGGFQAVYPGDGSARWAAYSGKTPTFLQYSSAATIAGLTTCDANAYRGSVDQLRTLIEGGDVAALDTTNVDWQFLYPRVEAIAKLTPPQEGPEKDQDLPILQLLRELKANTEKAAAAAGQAVPVTLAADQLDELAQKVAALLAPAVASPTAVAAAVVDEEARRLGNG